MAINDKEIPKGVFQRVSRWLEQLKTDDRLMIIIATSRLDDLLKKLLQKTMRHESGGQDSLFSSNHALGSFSSRILLAYRLGLIDRDYESFLQTLRKLRNDAAHASQQMDLSTAPHIDRVICMQSLASKSPVWDDVNEAPIVPQSDPSESLFISLAFAVLCAELYVLDAKPFQVDDVCGFHMMRMAPEASR